MIKQGKSCKSAIGARKAAKRGFWEEKYNTSKESNLSLVDVKRGVKEEKDEKAKKKEILVLLKKLKEVLEAKRIKNEEKRGS